MTNFNAIKKVYSMLQDDESRFIFEKRLLYSLSGEKRYINEMVSAEIERYWQEDMAGQLIQWLEQREGDIFVFGAGWAGQSVVNVLSCFGKRVRCLIDNNANLHGTQCMGLNIVAPGEILNAGGNFSVIIAVNKYAEEICCQLTEMGIEKGNIFVPAKEWWLGKYPQYFDADIISPKEQEVFVDGGSLDGNDSIRFMEWCDKRYDAIYAFEPDPSNCKAMQVLMKKYERLTVYEQALWNDNTELRFATEKKENSGVSDEGDKIISATSIDKSLSGVPVTFIKMDIEGSEMQALIGAEQTIRRNKPRLAVCVYHKPEDIIDLPLKILELNPEYKLYLRHYSYLHTETVLYAV